MELQLATNNFNYDNKLGEGGFGSVYWVPLIYEVILPYISYPLIFSMHVNVSGWTPWPWSDLFEAEILRVSALLRNASVLEQSGLEHARPLSSGGIYNISDSILKHASSDFTKMGQRIFVFIVGGATRSELRVCHKLSTKLRREIVLGSSSLDDPPQFITMLSLVQPSSTQNWLGSQGISSGLIVKQTIRVDVPVYQRFCGLRLVIYFMF